MSFMRLLTLAKRFKDSLKACFEIVNIEYYLSGLKFNVANVIFKALINTGTS